MSGSSAFFHKPELALRRAIELAGIHQEEAALTLLHDVLSSRRHRTWSPTYEQIMMTYLDLCLSQTRSREAKDGLHQYRNLSQSQAPGSLEKVIRYLMEKAEQKCAQAKQAADLEEERCKLADSNNGGSSNVMAESVLLSTMSTDPAKAQRDSTLLLPAVKFLWEVYRAVLDILRSNSKLEHVYHAAAQGALRACRIYKRRMEFRHLCDMLRQHLSNLRQYGAQFRETPEEAAAALEAAQAAALMEGGDPAKIEAAAKAAMADPPFGKQNSKIRGWEGWTTESIELHLETRFVQLETASVLHRYTEGFKTVEDIYHILQLSHARRKANPSAPPPKAKVMAAYYEKLTDLFWVSENYLFHAFAWYKYYQLCKEYNRSMSADTKQAQASAVVLAALCIPSLPNKQGATAAAVDGTESNATNSANGGNSNFTNMEDEIIQQKMGRMAVLLGFHTRHPSREVLLAEIKSQGLLDVVPSVLKDLYLVLEENSDPTDQVTKAKPLLDQLKKDAVLNVANDAVQLSMYVKPVTHVLLLKLIINLSAAYTTVSMDHLKRMTAELNGNTDNESDQHVTFEEVEKAIVWLTQTRTVRVKIDHRTSSLRFGDALLESDAMRSQLVVLSKQLQAVTTVLHPPKPSEVAARLARRKLFMRDIAESLPEEHARIVARKEQIEQNKEQREIDAQKKQKEEEAKKAAEEAARRAEEAARIAKEQRLRQEMKLKKIQQELENQETKRILVAMGKKTADYTEEEISKIDTAALQREHQEKANAKREEAERKTREAAKKLDYLVRAMRIEELPRIRSNYQQTIAADRARYEKDSVSKVEKAREQWQRDIQDRALLEKHGVFDFFKAFEEPVLKGRRAVHEAACAAADKEAEMVAERDKIRRARGRKEKEARRLADEEAARIKEERERKEAEEKRKREEAKREKEAAAEARRQAEVKRMDEERRRNEQSNSRAPPSGGFGGGKYVPPSQRNRGGGDRGGYSRSGDAGGYGGGRYGGRNDRSGGGGGGYGGDRRDGGGMNRDRSGPSSGNNRWRN